MPDILEAAVDHIEEGIIIVDTGGIIRVYNQKAREIFAIDPRTGPGHPEGRIRPGHITVLVNNCIGHDDGGLTPDDLKLIGVDPASIRPGEAVVAIGVCGGLPGSALWQSSSVIGPAGLEVCRNLDNIKHIKARIDGLKRCAVISVGSQSFEVPYQVSIGHLVLVSPESLEVAFYQTRGYTSRGEDLRNILHGKQFVAKGPGAAIPNLVGRHILEIHPDSVSVHHLIRVIKGERESVKDQEYPINGIPVRCSVAGLCGESGLIGGLLLVRDISEIKYLERQLRHSVVRPAAFAKIVGSSREVLEAIRVAERASQTRSTVLLLGESGTGKGLFAKAIHQNGPRCDGPFVHVNLAAIPASLVESELFGYEAGAFTGAKRNGKPGLFQLANGGTIFLDEIGEMDPSIQAKLLHVFQDNCIYPVGAVKKIELDLRVIAATNRNLENEVRKGTFREDLFYRLNVISLQVPSLRDRRSDIPELVEALLPSIGRKVGKAMRQIAPEALQILMQCDWPGNVRELENVLESACNLTEGDVIQVDHFPKSIRKISPGPVEVPATLRSAVEGAEKQSLVAALKATGGNRTQAMKMLGIGRTSFYEKLNKYGLT